MKSTSRIALAAASGLLLSVAMTPTFAADIGSGCCADLEERVAELEATTARKGNRTVSLLLYGQVNMGLLYFDDGHASDAYVVDNTMYSTRVGMLGKAQIKPGLTAGYTVEYEFTQARADFVTQGKDGDDIGPGLDTDTMLRMNYLYLQSDTLGTLSIGKLSTAADYSLEVNLSNSWRTSDPRIGISLRPWAKEGFQSASRIDDWARNFRTGRDEVIRYDTPSIYGFILSASWSNNDFADVALRYWKEFGDIRLSAASSYQWDSRDSSHDNHYQSFGGSMSVMHLPTGLYLNLAAARKDFTTGLFDNPSMWYVQGGIERKWLPYGATTLYGEYGKYREVTGDNDPIGKHSQAERLGVGVVQRFDSAAMDIYAHANLWSFEIENGFQYEDMSSVLVGARISF